VDLFHLIGEMERAFRLLVSLSPGRFDHSGIHGPEFMSLAGHGLFEIFPCGTDPLQRSQMAVRVDRFRIRRRPEQPGGLGKPLLVRLGGKGQILPVGLGFAGEGLPQCIFRFGHHCFSFPFHFQFRCRFPGNWVSASPFARESPLGRRRWRRWAARSPIPSGTRRCSPYPCFPGNSG